MRLSLALIVTIFSACVATSSRAGTDAGDVVILSVTPRSADVRPVIVPPQAQPGQAGAQQSAEARKAGKERAGVIPENRPVERARPDTVLIAL